MARAHSRRPLLTLVALLGSALALVGCDNSQKGEVSLLTEENQTLRTQLDDRNRALEASDSDATDEAALVEALGVPVLTVAGDPRNLKITAPGDLRVAAALLKD